MFRTWYQLKPKHFLDYRFQHFAPQKIYTVGIVLCKLTLKACSSQVLMGAQIEVLPVRIKSIPQILCKICLRALDLQALDLRALDLREYHYFLHQILNKYAKSK